MAKAVEIPVVVKKGTLSRSIEGEALAATRKLGGSGSRAVQPLGKMLGKIRADADEFTKSIEASNARVIAFGASVAVINGISRAFKELVTTTIRVEKTLADINVVLNTTQKGIEKFGDGIFKVARNTAQSFDVAAEAALEFSRQGLSTEETLKRVNDALILTRLTGLKASESVKGLTAAVNGFGKAGLTTTQIINKLSAVDVKFAVGTDDLIAALSRAGAVAQDAGVNFDELVAMVTVAQQRTARGGAVIGNAFKTIYTRLQDPKALNALRNVNIAVDDLAGAALPANRVLQNLAGTYDTLTRTQKASIDQFVAGKFQINILKAALGDLGKANSDYARAEQTSANATDQAIQKNKQLNQTVAALASQSGVAVEQLVSKIGDITVGPGIKNLLTTINSLVESMTKGLSGDSVGATFAKGLLKGIGGVLTGPGLVVVGGVFIKLFKDLVVFGSKSLKNLLGLNNAAKQQAAIQTGINQLLGQNVAYQQAMAAAAGNVTKQQALTNSYLAAEVRMRQQAGTAAAGLAAGAYAGGFRVSGGGALTRSSMRRGVPGFAPGGGGAIPNLIPLFGKGMTKELYKNQSLAGQIGTSRGAAVENLISSYIGHRSAGAISTRGQGRISAGADISGGTFAGFDAKAGGFLAHSGGSPDKGYLRAVAQGGRTMHPWEQMAAKAPGSSKAMPAVIGELGGLKRIDYNQRFFNPSHKAYGETAGMVARGVSPGKGYKTGDATFDASIPGFLERAKSSNRSYHSAIQSPVSEQNLMENFFKSLGKQVGVTVGPKQFSGSQAARSRELNDATYQQILAKLPQLPAGFEKMGPKARKQAQAALNAERLPILQSAMGEAQSIEAIAMMKRRFSGGYPSMAPNFSPLSDAVSRERKQVGALMGISPSSVQTKVVQNSSLRSSFNPQGFGVISPTVGQNSFADAARMHSGEDLRTTNLPNFAKDMSPGSGPSKKWGLRDPSFIGPRAPTEVKVVAESASVSEKRGAEIAKASAKETKGFFRRTFDRIAGEKRMGMRVSGVGGYLNRTMAGRTGLSTGLGAARGGIGAMAGPAMTTAFMYPMVEPFLPGMGGTEERYGMTGQQRLARSRKRRQVQGAIGGGMLGYTLAGGAMAAAQAMPAATPYTLGAKALLYGAATLGGTALGAGVTPSLFGSDENITPRELGQASESFSMKARNDQELVSSFRQSYSAYLSSPKSSPQEAEALKNARKTITAISDQDARTQLTSLLAAGKAFGANSSPTIIDPLGQSSGGGRVAFPDAAIRAGLNVPTVSNPLYNIRTPAQALARVGEIGRDASERGMAPARWAQVSKIGFESKEQGSVKLQSGKRREDLKASLMSMSENEFKQVSRYFKGRTTNTRGITSFSGAPSGDIRQTREGLLQGFGIQGQPDSNQNLLDSFMDEITTERARIKAAGGATTGAGATEYVGKPGYMAFQKGLQRTISDQRLADIGLQGRRDQQKMYGDYQTNMRERFGFTDLTVARSRRDVAVQGINNQLQLDQRGLRTGEMAKLPGLTKDFGMLSGGPQMSNFLEELIRSGTPAQMRAFSESALGGPGDAAKTGISGIAGQLGFSGKDLAGITQGAGDFEMQGMSGLFNALAQNADELNAGAEGAKEMQDALVELARTLKKDGVAHVAVEAFQGELADAFHSVSMNAKSGSDALRDFGLNMVAAINRKVMGDLASSITEGLFGNSFGMGFNASVTAGPLSDPVKAQNGMYISGNRTGDKNPALLEDGEYVLNRNAVKALGGPSSLDSINFGMAPRFAEGGGFMGGLGKILMTPFSLIGKLFQGIFGGGGGGGRKRSRASAITGEGTSIQSGRARNLRQQEEILAEMVSKEPALKKAISQYGSGGGKIFSGEELGDTWKGIVSRGTRSGGKSAMARYDQILSIYGPNALNKLIGPNDQPMNRVAVKSALQKFYGVSGFQSGGFFSGISKKDRQSAQKEIGVAINSSAYDDVNQSGFMLANDPQMQRMMGFFNNRQRERWQKDFDKQQQRDALNKGLVSSALAFSINAGIGQLTGGGNKQADMVELKQAYPGQSESFYQEMGSSSVWRNRNSLSMGDKMSNFMQGNMSRDAFSSYDYGAAWRNEKPMFNQQGIGRKMRTGGYIDNIPALLTGGEFVVGRNAVQHYGTGYLNRINKMQDGGLVGSAGFEQGNGGGQGSASTPTTNNNNVGITVNFGSDATPEVKTVQGSASEDPQQFANKIRGAVLDVLNQEQRVGGSLRSQKKGRR